MRFLRYASAKTTCDFLQERNMLLLGRAVCWYRKVDVVCARIEKGLGLLLARILPKV